MAVNWNNYDKWKNENKNKSTSNSKKTIDWGKYEARKQVDFNTFESDLANLNPTVESIANGWQNEETLTSSYPSIKAMYDRLNAYQKYRGANEKLPDLSETSNYYKKVLDNWDNIVGTYGDYKSAEEYNKAVEREKSLPTANLDSIMAEITYIDSQINTIKSIEEPEPGKTFKDYVLEIEELERKKAERKTYYNDAKSVQEEIKLNKEHKTRAKTPEAIQGWEQFLADQKAEKEAERNQKYGVRDAVVDEISETGIDSLHSAILMIINQKRKNADKYEKPSDDWEQEEKHIFGSYYNEDLQNGTNKAGEYALRLNKSKREEKENKAKQKTSDSSTSSFWAGAGHTGLSFLAMPTGIFDFIDNATSVAAGQPIMPDGVLTPFEYGQTVRGAIGEKLNDWSGTLPENIPVIGGKGVGDIYQLGTGVVDSAASAFTLGSAGTLVSYFGQGAASGVDDALSRGATDDQALLYGTILGAAEGVSESIGADKLVGINSSDTIQNLLSHSFKKGFGKKLLKLANKQGWAEGLEEGFSSIVGKVADQWIMKDKSEFNLSVQKYMSEGLSESKATNKAWVQSIYDIASDVLDGYISGGIHTGFSVPFSMHKTKAQNETLGGTIRETDNVGNVLNTLAMTPEESETYQTYKRYFDGGVNADNVTDAQLGNMYAIADEEARDILSSRKSTLEQRQRATDTLKKLSSIYEEGTVDKETIENIDQRNAFDKFKQDVETKLHNNANDIISYGLEQSTNTNAYKLASKLKEKEDNGVTPSTQELVKLQEANARAVWESEALDRAENLPKLEKDLFLKFYDGKTDIEYFSTSFNYVTQAVKEGWGYDYVQQHKGALTNRQVGDIYRTFTGDKNKKLKKSMQKLREQFANAPVEAGTLDDSIINYTNENIKGKVRWNSLRADQKKGIILMSVVALKSGMNIKLVDDGEKENFNGYFVVKENTIYVDVHAGLVPADGLKLGKSLIIPTLSHEITHWMEEKVPELYRKYSEYVMDTLKMSGKTEEQLLNEKLERLTKNHSNKKYDADEVRRELVAEASANMFAKSEEIQKMLSTLNENERSQFVQKVKEILHDIKNWLNNFLAEHQTSSQEAKTIEMFQDRIDEQIKLWDKMLKASIETNQAMKKSGKTVVDEDKATDIQFAVRNSQNTNISIERYTKKQYNDYGWIAVNKVLTGKELKKLYAQFSNIKDHKNYNYKNILGEYIIPVGDKYGTIDKLVYIKGTVKNPVIRQVVEFISTIPNEVRENIIKDVLQDEYDRYYTDAFEIAETYARTKYFIRHMASDLPSYSEIRDQRRRQNGSGNSFDVGKRSEGTRDTKDSGRKVSGKLSKETEEIKHSDRDSLDNELSKGQIEYFKDSKVRDEDGNLLVVYHGTYADFTVFDRTKSRSNMDIQGSFFSPWELDSKGYGPNVKAYYLNIKNPASASVAYKALNKFKGQNDAGVKAREYLESIGYDGVNFDNEEYIVFNSEQAKLTDNLNPTEDKDIRYADREISDLDAEYLELAKSPEKNEARLRELVDEAAKKAGYTQKVYHGTNQFGFTKFEGTEGFSYDEIQFFATDSLETANTYAGTDKVRRVSEEYELDYDIEDEYEERARDVASDLASYMSSEIGYYGYIDSEYILSKVKDGGQDDMNELEDEWLFDIYKGNYTDEYEEFYEFQESEECEELLNKFYDYLGQIKSIYKALETYETSGIYEFVANTDNLFVIEGNGRYWNALEDPRLPDRILNSGGKDIKLKYKTRDVCLWAKKQGYSGVLFKNIIDSGSGQNLTPANVYAFFNPREQVKSADLVTYDDEGNIIPLSKRFNLQDTDIRYADRETATMTTERIDYLIGDSGAGSRTDYAQAWITSINPTDFINLTTKNIQNREIFDKARSDYGNTMDDYDYLDALKEEKRQTPYLAIDIDTLQVVGHEGRHRMRALEKEGITSVPIRIEFRDEDGRLIKEKNGHGNPLEAIEKLKISNQMGTGQSAVISNIIPLNKANRDNIISSYGEESGESAIQFADREISDLDAEYLKLAQNPERNKVRLRELVDEEAKRNGYNSPILYHGTYAFGFTRIDTKKSNDHISFFTTDSLQTAGTYSGTGNVRNINESKESSLGIYQFYANINGMLELEANGEESNHIGLGLEARDFNYYLQPKSWHTHATAKQVSRYAKQKGYQGVIIQNVIDVANPDARKMANASNVYVFFKPQEQLKSADLVTYDDEGNIIPLSERFKQNNSDMRYADRDNPSVYELLGELETLRKENKSFREDVARLKERLKLEGQVTNGKKLNENQLGIVAGQIRKMSNSTFDKNELVNLLRDYYGYIMSAEELSWDEVFEQAYSIAEEVLEHSKQPKHTNEYYKTIMHNIRNSRISFSNEQKKEFEYAHGANWHKAFFGKVNVANNGVPLDIKWKEWSSAYPEIFKEDVNALDQANELYEIYDALKEGMEVYEEYDREEKARWLAYEIYDRFWRVNKITTTADKYDKQIKRLNYEHRNAMAEMRDKHNKQMEDQKLADTMHYGKMIAEERRKKDEALEEASKEHRESMSKLRNEKNKKLEEQKLADEMHYGKLIEKIKKRNEESLAEAKRLGKERLDSYKENAERKTKIQAITSKVLTLNRWMLKNNKDEHIPDVLKGPVKSLIEAIDFSSKRLLGGGIPTQKDISLEKALRQVKDMMVKANTGVDSLMELYGNDMDEELETLLKSVENTTKNLGDNEFILNAMSLEELKVVDKLVTTVKSAVSKLNEFHTVHHKKGIVNLAQETITYADSLGKESQNKYTDWFKKVWKWTNAIPYYAFKRYGEAGRKIFEAFQDGWDKLAYNVKTIIDFTKDTYKSKDVKQWSKEIKEFNVPIPNDNPNNIEFQKVKMTTTQIMSLYCLWKRKAAKEHIVRGGLRIAKIEGKRGEIIDQVEGLVLEANEVEKIINTLTDKQKAVADKLQEFMNTVASKWGNEISMARFGIEMFNEEFYFPIQVDNNVLPPDGNDEQVASKPSPNNDLFKLFNMSFTKSLTENANNRIVVNDIFNVFAQHTSDMAKYNALALPVLDAFRWFNYKEKEDINGKNYLTSSVQASIEKAFGKDGKNYITQFLKDINGTVSQSRDTLAVKFFKNSKIVSVGLNLRVILLQPTSFFRAGAVIDNKYLAKALVYVPNIAKLKKAMDRAKQYCGMALWKSMGYFDTNISRGITEQIKHAEGWRDKATNFSMWAAGKADEITLGVLWNAAELEIRDTRKDLKVGSEEFYKAVGLRLREIIYATQVVDSPMTRSEWMRSPDTHDKVLTMFASEPTLAQNMVSDAFIQTNLDARELGSKKEAFKKNKKKIAKVITAYVVTNAVAALVESGFDWYRDDDDEEMDLEEFMKLYLSNFAEDMSLIGKIPYIKDCLSMLKGYSSSRSELQWMEDVYQVYKNVSKHLQGEGNPEKTLKNIIKLSSYVSTLGLHNVYKDVMSGLYKLDILDAEDFEEMLKDWWNID